MILEKRLLNIKCVIRFSLQILYETFLIPRRSERDIIKMYVALHVKYPLFLTHFNPLMPNDPYSGRSAPLTSKRCILYIYSTNTGTEYFEHGIYSPFFFSLQNAVSFIILTYLVPVFLTFYIKNVLKFKKIIPAPKG